MTTCSEHETLLWLDVYGELEGAKRTEWEKHLDTCRACRVERADAIRMMTRIKAALIPPPLPEEQLDAAVEQIRGQLVNQRTPAANSKRGPALPFRLIPIGATACLVLIGIGLSLIQRQDSDSPPLESAPITMRQPLAEEKELREENRAVIETDALLTKAQTAPPIEQTVEGAEATATSNNEHDGESRDDAETVIPSRPSN